MSGKHSKDDGKLKNFFFVEFMSFDLRNIQILTFDKTYYGTCTLIIGLTLLDFFFLFLIQRPSFWGKKAIVTTSQNSYVMLKFLSLCYFRNTALIKIL